MQIGSYLAKVCSIVFVTQSMLKVTKEYAQAFEFDQLNALMKKGTLFEGFHEAPINFPPTFKYDVSHKRRPKPSSSKFIRSDQSQHLQVDERVVEGLEDEMDEGMDAASIVSSIMSVVSRAATDPGVRDDYCQASASAPTVVTSTNELSNTTSSRKKHKGKWLSILSPSFVSSPKLPKFQHAESLASPSTPVTPILAFSVSPQSVTSLKSDTSKRFLRPPPMILVNPSASQSSPVVEAMQEKKGVYDTSSKKRVPSW